MKRRYRAITYALLTALAASCGPDAPTNVTPSKISTTYRVIGGVSMGAIGAAALGLSQPQRFDAVAVLGGPLDSAFFQRMMDDFVAGGFCPRDRLEALLATDPTLLNDPKAIAECAQPTAPIQWEHRNDFNHWHASNNGGNFNRNSYKNMIADVSLAFGNPFTESSASPVAPPGVDLQRIRRFPADFCSQPTVVKGLKNLEYNPDGKYDAITFCDGEPTLFFCRDTMTRVDFCSDRANIATPLPVSKEQSFADTFCAKQGGAAIADPKMQTLFWLANSGRVDPCREAVEPQGIMLAYDYNRNGRRDYGEPVVNNSHERFDDVGSDGCDDAHEDGKGGCSTAASTSEDPNHDNYDADENPNGTERNWQWEQGEPFRDHGLDGVSSTNDFGEGNGKYDVNRARAKLNQFDGRLNFKKLAASDRARLNILGDGGIRDVLNFGVMTTQLFGLLKSLKESPVGRYRDFAEIPGLTDVTSGNFKPWTRAWRKLPRDLITIYGKETPSSDEVKSGDGDHVGTNEQALNRFEVLFNWVANLWPNLSRPATPFGAMENNRQRVESFFSEKLSANWEYGVSLPPGYDAPENADKRYPVAYLLHGYGMSPKNLMPSVALTDFFIVDAQVQLRPVIYIFPNGRCCFINAATGNRDCRNVDENGNDLNSLPGWARECHSGTFFVNRSGYAADDQTPYGDALFELMDHVDKRFRTEQRAEVESR